VTAELQTDNVEYFQINIQLSGLFRINYNFYLIRISGVLLYIVAVQDQRSRSDISPEIIQNLAVLAPCPYHLTVYCNISIQSFPPFRFLFPLTLLTDEQGAVNFKNVDSFCHVDAALCLGA